MSQALDLLMKKRPTQGRSRATVEAVLEATAQLLAESGYAALTTNHIADRAGVSIGSIYQYFPGKEAIVAQVVDRVVDEILTEFGQGLLGGTLDHRHVATVLYDTIDRRAALMRTLTHEVPFLRDLPTMAGLRSRLLLLSSQIYDHNMGEKRFTHPNVATFMLTTMVQNAVIESILMPLPGMTREHAIETLGEILVRLAGFE